MVKIYSRTGTVWIATPSESFELQSTEGVQKVVAGRDVVSWRSEFDKWPQTKESLAQSYYPTNIKKFITLKEHPEPLEFVQYKPKPNQFISVRDPKENETTVVLPTGDILNVDPAVDVIAHKVAADGSAIGNEYVMKVVALHENYAAV
ncbi:hypothetical protein HK100_005903 [Physocladia obscura]|uniref:Uncharacterized protein n=1 Tax=Physocladia obscura TaxID=109957 RepID=A0AAD5XCY6_9FUNG|nr:hypothetical protein HK100_005903 [Physocladia obscura]